MTLANGIRPTDPSLTDDSAAAAVDVDQPSGISSTDTPLIDGVRKAPVTTTIKLKT